MKEFRCTRSVIYTADCPGRNDPSSRQGYYITAEDADEALKEMRKRFPDDVKAALKLGIKPFTSHLWRNTNALC